ncbi:PREDICTED: uncharacterized protein LOC109178520 [Ipomoea nil]|uniref:uncharacterized protein LOC109178520 n=1 Tax=Ipomoea nil TaxID=35883 RepID=UPI000900C342|nr:PREDICTED: uncharacterized protein LOC109178520 [Ipomoea nil]
MSIVCLLMFYTCLCCRQLMHISLSVMLVVKQNTQIITFTLRMGRQFMGLFKSSGIHVRICCLKLSRQSVDHLLTKNPFVFGKLLHVNFRGYMGRMKENFCLEIVTIKSDGLRLELLNNAHPKLLELMQRCREAVPGNRPSFSEVRAELEELLHEV